MSLWTKIVNFFNPAIRWFRKFMKEVFDAAMEILIAELVQIAKEIVEELAKTDFTNEIKRRDAFDKIKVIATRRGLKTKDHLINLAIELAVARLKKVVNGE